MVFYVIKLLNYFTAKGGVSNQYSPKAILSGKLVHFKYYTMPFGTYCQVHEEVTPWNSMVTQTQGAITLGPSGNSQGGHKFLSLTTGKVLTHQAWNILPMPTGVIKRVNTLAHSQPELLVFHDCQGHEIGDSNAPTFMQRHFTKHKECSAILSSSQEWIQMN